MNCRGVSSIIGGGAALLGGCLMTRDRTYPSVSRPRMLMTDLCQFEPLSSHWCKGGSKLLGGGPE